MHVHIINAHLTYPGWSDGKLNAAMVDKATSHLTTGGHLVTHTVVERPYDVHSEVRRHIEADLVVLQTPINWFGAPWIYKRYVDAVFNAGLHDKSLLDNDGRTRSDTSRQYGSGGHMHGKGFLVAATWNAPSTAFDDPSQLLFGGKSVDDLLLHIAANYKFVGYHVLQSYGIYDIFSDTADVAAGVEAYGRHLDDQIAELAAIRAATV